MASLLSFTILPKPNLTKVACSSSSTATTLSPPEIRTLDQKYGRKGIKFSDSSDVELTVRNGSSLKFRIPNGHITSYKPKVYWKDDGIEEIIYTLPVTDIGSSVTSTTTSATKAKGGIGLVINNVNASNPNSRSSHVITSEWSGQELFFRVIRIGFEDIYVSSPSSLSKKYGEDYFICTGSGSSLAPVVVNPGEEWRGAQVTEHDNL
ncbi:hypothetical protein RHSIM_Rhsim03G0001400 [Rhododendron simsii]|uniref:Uncharacterized protein n=1 Tax=Rhododendron simsii TaxID=118357 RepID=A0A834HIM2_RHOSS|nr:hypothetical protein RHSIM_Rhsim03G0001400 [Rhododendron simsii]